MLQVGTIWDHDRSHLSQLCSDLLPEFPREVTVFARCLERRMPNPTLDQVTGNTTLLENGDSPVPERMSRSDRDSDLLAEWLQNKAIHIPIDQWRSVAALEDSTRFTIAEIFLNDLHRAGVYVDFPVASFSLRGHFLMNESGPSDVNDQLREVQILNVKASYFSKSHACCKSQCE